jgi:hypothetical protein
MFTTLSDQFQENIARIELDAILEKIKIQLQQNLLIHPEEEQSISQQLDFPGTLGHRFRYIIQISNSSDAKLVVLSGRTLGGEILKQITFSLGSDLSINASGEYTSTSTYFNLYLQKNQNILTILITS